jgi:hypothetical protein
MLTFGYVRNKSTPADRRQDLIFGNPRHDHPCHFRSQPTNAVSTNDKIGRIENVALDEIQYGAVDFWPFRLH